MLHSYFFQESALFTEQALSIFKALSKVVSSFSNEQDLPAARKMLEKARLPQDATISSRKDHKVLVIPLVVPSSANLPTDSKCTIKVNSNTH